MAEGTERDATSEEPASSKRTRPYEDSVGERSDQDAMGNDKRRQVIGGQYGASVRKRLVVYGIAIAVIIGVVILSLTVVSNIDNKEIPLEDTAPWATVDTAPEPPRDIDYGRNGPQDTIPEEDVVNR